LTPGRGEHSLQLQHAADCIRDGGILAYAAESCFGLGCDPFNVEALERLLKIKQRSADQGLIVVAAQCEQLQGLVQWSALSETQQARVEASWPGPVSWLIPAHPDCPEMLRGQHSTLAVRVPAYKLVRDLCRQARMALVSSSANRHDQPALTTAAEVEHSMGAELDFILDAPIQGRAQPSRIVDAMTQQILRA